MPTSTDRKMRDMEGGEIEIREAGDGDAARIVELSMRANPTSTSSPEAWLHRRRTTPPRARPLWLVAERDGLVVAYGIATLDADIPDSTTAYLAVVVDELERRRGIGARLHDLLEEHARAIGGSARQAMLFERPESVAFAAARGYAEVRAAYPASVDPRTIEQEVRAGVDVVPFTELDPRDVHRVDEEATLDEPSPETIPGFPYDEWLDSLWRRPDLTHEGSFAALDGGVPVAFAAVYVAPALGRAVNGFTATLRAHRGQGLAYACKVASLRWAAANGITEVWTANDDTNAPMLAINRKLGYRQTGRIVTVRRPG